jgi:hypothetical protein
MGKTSIGLPNKKGDRSGAGEGKLKINSVKRCTILGQPPILRKNRMLWDEHKDFG